MSTMDKARAMLHIQSSGWCKELCFNLHKLQTSGKLCDVTIQTSDTKDIPAHSSILAAASPLLEHSISSSPGVQKLCFHNIHSGIWKLLLDYIYTGEMLLPSNHIEPILRASNFLQLNRLIDALSTICGQFQNSSLDSHTTTSKVYLDSETKNIMEVVSQSPVKKPDVQTSTQNEFETNSEKPLVSSVSTSSGNEHHVVSVPKSSESKEHNFNQCHKENQITVSSKKSLSQIDNQVGIQYGSSPIKIDQNVVPSKPNDDTEVLNSSTNVTIECSVHSALDSSTIGKASVSSIHPIKEVNQSSSSSTIEVVNDAGSKKSPVQKGRSNFALNPQENEAVKKIIDIIAEVHGKMEASKRAGKCSLKKQTSNDKAHENQQTANVQSGSRNGTASSLTCINKDDEKNCQEASAVVNNEIRITDTSENDQNPLRIIESESQSHERKRNLEENMELKMCSDSRYSRNEQCTLNEVKETSYSTGKEHSNHKNISTNESSSSLINKEQCLPVKIKSLRESEQQEVGANSGKKTVHAKRKSTQKQMATRQGQLHKRNPQIVKHSPIRQNLRKKESKSQTLTRQSPFRQLMTRSTSKKQSEATDVKLHSEALQSAKKMNTCSSEKNKPGEFTPAASASTAKIAETSQQLATHEHIGSMHNSASNEKKEEALQLGIKGRQSKSLLAELQQELDRSKSPKKRPAVRRSSRIRNSAMSSEILNTVKKMKSMFEKNQAKQENSKNKDPECRESDLNKPQQLNWPSTEITNRRRLSLLDLAEVAVKKEHLEALASEGNKQDLNTSCISNVSSTDSSILGKMTNDDNFTSDDLEVIKHNKKERRENVSHGMVLSKEAAIAKGLMKENLPSESKNDRNRIVLTVEKYPIDRKVVIHVPSPVSCLNVNAISQGEQKQNSQLYCDALKGRENVLQVEQSLNINPPETANNSSDMTNKFDSSCTNHDPDVPLNLSIHSNEDHTSTNENPCVIRQSSSPLASNINGPETIESGLDMSIKSPNIMNNVAQSSPLVSGSSGNSATLDLSTTSANNGPIIISKPLPSKYQAARPSYIFVCMKCDAEFPKRSRLEEHMKSGNCVVPKTLESSEGIEDKDVQVCEICGSIVTESNLEQHRAQCSSSLTDSDSPEQEFGHSEFHTPVSASASSMKKVTAPSSNVSSITIPVISSHDMKEMAKNGNSSSYKPSIQTLQNPYNNFQYSSSNDQKISRAGDEKHFDTLKDRSLVSEKVVSHKTINNESSKPQCKNNVYGCKTCSQKFSTSLELAIHSKCYHLTLNQNPNEFEICYKCQKQVDGKNHGLSRHLWKEHKLKTIAELDYLCCSQCNFRTCESSVNKGHYRRVHGNSNKMANSLKCAYCLQGFVSRQKLEEHQLVHDWPASKPFGCHFCEQRFSKVAHLESHIPLHTGQYPYVCRICNDAFAGVMSVNKHLSAKHGLKKELFKENVTYTAYECNQLSDKNFKEQDAFVVTGSGLTSTEKSASLSAQSDGACAVPDNLVQNVNEHRHQNESLPNKALNYEVELLEYQQDDNIVGSSKSGEYFVVSLPSEPQENVRSELIYSSQRDNQSGQFTALTNEIEAYTQDLNIMGEVEISTADEPSPGGSSTNVTGYDIRNDELAMQNSESRVPVNLKPHQCPYCFKRYYNVKTLEDHLPYHTGLMPYTCCLCSQQFATLMLINRHLGKDHQVSKKMYKSYRAYVKHEANIVQAGSKTVSLSERCQHLLQVIKQRDMKVAPKEVDTFEEDTNLQELLEEARKGSVVGKSEKKESKKRKKSSKPDDSEETQQQQQETSSKKKKVERRNSQLESYEFVKKLVHELNHQYGFAETDDESQISAEDVAGILESGQVVVSEQDEVQKGNTEEGVVYVVSDDQHQDGYAIIQ